MRRAACLLALLAIVVNSPVNGQTTTTPPVKQPTVERAKTERMLYLVRYGDAKMLATALSQHYKNETELQIVADANSNALLITAPKNLLTELMKAVDQLDRRPKQVMIEVLIVELPIEEEAAVDPKDFDKPIDKIMPALEAMSKKGKVNHLRRFQLSALENQKSSLTTGESKPIVSGVGAVGGFGGGGRGAPGMVQNQITYHQVGSTIGASPRVSPDGTITIDLNFEESALVSISQGIVDASKSQLLQEKDFQHRHAHVPIGNAHDPPSPRVP